MEMMESRKKARKKSVLIRYLPLLIAIFLMRIASEDEVFAADTVTVSIPIEQIFTVNPGNIADTDGKFVYQLMARGNDIPMPEGSNQDGCQIVLNKNESASIGPIIYHSVGTYEYQLGQVIDSEKEGYTYDKQVYQISVYVENTEDRGFVAEIVAMNINGEKVGNILFANSYAGKKEPAVESPEQEKNDRPTTTKDKMGMERGSGKIKTGDQTKILLLLTLCIGSGVSLVLIRRNKKITKGN